MTQMMTPASERSDNHPLKAVPNYNTKLAACTTNWDWGAVSSHFEHVGYGRAHINTHAPKKHTRAQKPPSSSPSSNGLKTVIFAKTCQNTRGTVLPRKPERLWAHARREASRDLRPPPRKMTSQHTRKVRVTVCRVVWDHKPLLFRSRLTAAAWPAHNRKGSVCAACLIAALHNANR